VIWQHWMPTPQQMSDAIQLRRNAYTSITMQQAMGMIVFMALIAGLIPFISSWILAARMGAALPLAQLATAMVELRDALPWLYVATPGLDPNAMTDFTMTAAGLDQPLPDWLAAGLSAFGGWLSWPLNWLTVWIVYGALVVVANKAFGATMTLQYFYAATGYAALPLLLTGLGPVPCLGPLATLAGVVWAAVIYICANEEVTGLTRGKAVAATLLPILLLGLLALILLGTFLISTLLFFL
jgi:hypothetical protein